MYCSGREERRGSHVWGADLVGRLGKVSWKVERYFFFTTVQLYTEYRVNKHHDKTGNKEPFEIFKEVEEKGYDQAKCSADKSAK